ncbi:transmembrane protein, putative (macronuclear) [Tetrahymena thermophila SB210]|uniref:Transmembrane protein, putative n=1 Tax=Tetrahymena thermophila (strain SB210) TaxID=312017 RepID=W7XF85_TETTS|nr:transmembrane protein, putative [Tetrahymena thermophila SB210]EWS72656.1 transmembrane protein, putative [Tetrahymena thermophila SB210]|eukprot:XP_012654824.1 transmembrane protein, putative [Tetrahymena thermophila SB210]
MVNYQQQRQIKYQIYLIQQIPHSLLFFLYILSNKIFIFNKQFLPVWLDREKKVNQIFNFTFSINPFLPSLYVIIYLLSLNSSIQKKIIQIYQYNKNYDIIIFKKFKSSQNKQYKFRVLYKYHQKAKRALIHNIDQQKYIRFFQNQNYNISFSIYLQKFKMKTLNVDLKIQQNQNKQIANI